MNFEDCIFSAFIGQDSTMQTDFSEILINFLTEKDAYQKDLYKNLLIENYCTVKEFDCNIKDMKKIGEGSFGAIYSLNNKTVVKFPISESDSKRTPGCFKKAKDYHVADFIEEQITNIILYCLKPNIEKVFPNYIQSVPDIFLISKMVERDNNQNYNIGAFMEKLLPVKWNIPFLKIVEIILQVANTLYILQTLCKFMHRDLHLSNIMLKQNNSKNKDIILYNGYVLKNQEFIVILIDFGNACALIPSGDDYIKVCSDSSRIYGQCEECKFNKSYDLRMFMASLYMLKNMDLDDMLDRFFKKEKFINHEKAYPKDIKFHSYYTQSLYTEDLEFYPEYLIEILDRLIKVRTK